MDYDPNALSSYDFELPENLIAAQPANPRDSSRLLVVNRVTRTLEHRKFSDLPEYVRAGDAIVANNTKVIKARLMGKRLVRDAEGVEITSGKTEFVLLEELKPKVWEGLFHASAKYKVGLRFQVETPDGQGLHGTIVRASIDSPHGTIAVEFDRDPLTSGAGELPLPYYIKRQGRGTAIPEDEMNYQTRFAKVPGSAAAPTAGLHFTPELIAKLQAQGVSWNEITLHVGLGTFRPVKSEDVSEHLMHEERFEIPEGVATQLNELKSSRSGKVFAIGTTSVRTLESASEGQILKSGPGRTSIFIRPGAHEFKIVDAMITNFHLPKSTLLMLVCTFADRDLILHAYREAVKNEYRFYSYGDAMLIL
jgi:S-adenosylmethionine:tRNA ribosyltransferase-isomerase